ncbi:MAG: class II fructose-bisphosphate aldolase [Deltaproteobacteria bacterium]|nr:class II fructose-bisphosphate aldolase [Deltaproteobacteria bacterium]
MEFKTVTELNDSLKGCVERDGEECRVTDSSVLAGDLIDRIVYTAVHGESAVLRNEARAIIKAIANAQGIRSDSIQGLYEAMGRGECEGFTVPAINIRGLTYDSARAVFRAALKNNAAAFIFEIAKSEIGYTEQRPVEYTACILAAAIKEGYKGPVFIQGDHFQINASKYEADKSAEITALKELIKEAVEAEFYNIDIDSSTIVDLSREEVIDQQRPNFEVTAVLTSYIRELEKDGITISVGGEIGEVGKKNSTEEELRAFMDGFLNIVGERFPGISKISVQTGTSHGGVVLPDGSIASVKVDFDTIELLTKVAKEYGMSGVVQHGASTLPDDAFHIFAEKGASEVHLATGFQNMIYDSDSFPQELKTEIYEHLKTAHKDEWGEGVTEEQFLYKTRKKGFGPFKKKMWDLPTDIKTAIGKELEDRFVYLFEKLKAVNNADVVKKYVG